MGALKVASFPRSRRATIGFQTLPHIVSQEAVIVGIVNSRIVVNIEIKQTVADGDAFQVDGRFGRNLSRQCGHVDASVTLSFNCKKGEQ